jgi:hypothetical protein
MLLEFSLEMERIQPQMQYIASLVTIFHILS